MGADHTIIADFEHQYGAKRVAWDADYRPTQGHQENAAAAQAAQFRVFLAAPDGLERERELFREALREFNSEAMADRRIKLQATGFEQLSSDAERLRISVNEQVRTCNYFVVILWDSWRNRLASDSSSASDISEALNAALRYRGDAEAPMRDIAVFFKGLDNRRLSDPGPRLQQVLKFKTELEGVRKTELELERKTGLEQKRAVYYKPFDSDVDLKRELRFLFREWNDNYSFDKESVDSSLAKSLESLSSGVLDLLRESRENRDSTGSSGHDSPAGTSEVGNHSSSDDVSELLQEAWEHEIEGRIADAETKFADAATTSDPELLIAYAKFLRRAGRLHKSLEVNEQALQALESRDIDASTADAKRSEILANVGVIYRKHGDRYKSMHFLRQAIHHARLAGGEPGRRAEAYALDNLGLTFRQAGRQKEAREKFETARELRERIGDKIGATKSAINIARHLCADGKIEQARRRLEDALETLREADEDIRGSRAVSSANRLVPKNTRQAEAESCRSQATALSLLGDVMRASGENEKAAEQYREALELNERVHHVEGVAIVCGQLARLHIAMGKLDRASEYSDRCLEANRQAGNENAVASAYQIIGEVSAAQGEYKRAADRFATAYRIFDKNGNLAAALHSKVREARVLSKLGRQESARSAAVQARSLSEGEGVSTAAQTREDLDRLLAELDLRST